jgi:hypothetical protein
MWVWLYILFSLFQIGWKYMLKTPLSTYIFSDSAAYLIILDTSYDNKCHDSRHVWVLLISIVVYSYYPRIVNLPMSQTSINSDVKFLDSNSNDT